jgi:hypothetical protein
MQESSLVVTYRKGRPLAAYYYLAGRTGRRSHRCKRAEKGLVIDFARNGDPIGIEITSPTHVTPAALNRVLKGLRLPPLKRGEIAPLRAAS